MTVASSHLHTVVDSDGAAILDMKRGLISTVNATGAFVWQALRRGETVSAVITNLVRETGEDVTTVERDVLDFIESLKEQHLLER
jgi:putative NADH-flavin reductase